MIGPAALRFFGRQDRVIDRLFRVVAAAEMKRQEFRDFVDAAGIEFLERMSDGAVMGPAMPFEQTSVRGFLRQRMAKHVDRALGLDALVDEFETDQLAQLVFYRPAALPHGIQQAKREFPSDHRGGLEKPFGFVRQSVDPRHHDVVDRIRDHEIRAQIPRLAGMQCQLLEEKRIAVAFGDDFLGQQVDELLRPKHRADHQDAVVPRQWLQRGLPRIRLVDPRRPVAGPVSGEQQDPNVAKILREKAEKLLRYLVDPMKVLEHQNERTPVTALTASCRRVSKALLLTASGFDSAGEPATSLNSSRWNRTGPSSSGSIPTSRRPARTLSAMISGASASKIPQLLRRRSRASRYGDRGAVGEASSFDPGHPSVGDLPAELGEEPGLADARLTDEANGLAMSVFDLPKKIVQDRELALAIDKNRRARRRRLRAARNGDGKRRAGDMPGSALPCL